MEILLLAVIGVAMPAGIVMTPVDDVCAKIFGATIVAAILAAVVVIRKWENGK